MSELPSAQALPVELVPPPPPTSADNPELCAELDDVGDHELSWKTQRISIAVKNKKNFTIMTIPLVVYLFRTWDVTSICQDEAAEFVEVLHGPLFPLWGLQQHVCQHKI